MTVTEIRNLASALVFQPISLAPKQIATFTDSNNLTYDWWTDWIPAVGERKSDVLTYAIMNGGTVCGAIALRSQDYVDANKRRHKRYNIEMIEISKTMRGHGLGKAVLYLILHSTINALRVQAVLGESMPSAIPFWYSMGANFESSKTELRKAMELGYSMCFQLSTKAFDNAISSECRKKL